MSDLTQSAALDQLALALVKAQGQVKSAIKDSSNPFYKSTYADLASVWEACREALTANGLSVVQLPGYRDGITTLTTILLHVSGQWIGGTAGAPLAPRISRDGKETAPDAQSVGSAITYLRRYGLAAIAGVVQEDDDAESAVRGKAGRGKGAVGSAKDATPAPVPVRAQMSELDKRPAALGAEPPLEQTGSAPGATWKGKPIHGMPSERLTGLRRWLAETGETKWVGLMDAIDEELATRGGE